MTFMRYFYMGARLRRIMNTVDWPELPIYQQWFDLFKKTFSDRVRGTRVTDALSFESLRSPGPLTADTYEYNEQSHSTLHVSIYDSLLSLINTRGSTFASAYGRRVTRQVAEASLPTKADFKKNITHRGLKFTAGGRDSYVTYRIQSGQSEVYGAGQIESIFLHRRREGTQVIVEPFVVIQEYLPLSPEHARLDPYRQFTHLNTMLYYNKVDTTPRVIPLDGIVAHFAGLVYTPEDIGKQCMVVRSLDRVSSISNLTRRSNLSSSPTELIANNVRY